MLEAFKHAVPDISVIGTRSQIVFLSGIAAGLVIRLRTVK